MLLGCSRQAPNGLELLQLEHEELKSKMGASSPARQIESRLIRRLRPLARRGKPGNREVTSGLAFRIASRG